MGIKIWLLALIVAAGVPLSVFAVEEESAYEWAVMAGYGQSKDDVDVYRAGLQRDFKAEWFSTRVGCLTGYHEASLGWWEKEGDNVQVVAYSPVFAYRFNIKQVEPYVEFGIGISLISDTTIGRRSMSTYYQFEDRFGFGARLGENGRHDLNFRYMHYSNGATQQPNDGIDIFIGSYAFRF